MALIFGRVRQDSYDVQAEGVEHNARMNPRGEIVIPDWMTQLVMDGVVYNASNAVQETAERISETARGTDNVNPSFLLDVPSGSTVIPLMVMMDFSVPGTSEDMAITLNTDNVVRFSSGGVAITPLNMRSDGPNTASSTFYSGSTQIVTIANALDETLDAVTIEAEATPKTTASGLPLYLWSARQRIPKVLIGPAAFMGFIIGATDDHDWHYSVTFAEFTTTDVT